MNKMWIFVAGFVGIVLIGAVIFGTYWMNVSNKEVQLRNLIVGKQRDNTSEYDNMWKKIAQVAQVPEEKKNALKEIFTSHAQARTTPSNNVVMNWIKESVPTVNMDIYDSLMNIITSSRDSWTMRQKELIDFKREHDNLIDMFPSSLFVGSRGKIDIKIITSTKTERVFEQQKDDDITLFQKGVEK